MNFEALHPPAHVIAAKVQGRRISALEVTEAALAAIAARDPDLNAFTCVTADRARTEAAAVDAAVAEGRKLPLAGVPYAVKNLFDVEGVVTLAGSKINRDRSPALRDATLVTRLREAGAILLGALNMGEYAYDFTGENAHDGRSANPHDLSRMTGGSSSGSGGAVAAGMVALSLGSDTNGSIRVPSSFCGLYGLKPTFGRLSRGGVFPFVASLDHVGPLARSALDLAIAFDLLQYADAGDPAQAKREQVFCVPLLDKGVDGLRIAVAGGYFRKQGMPEAFAAVDAIACALGATQEVELPEAGRARAAAFIITGAESGALHLGRLRARPQDFAPDVCSRLMAGAMMQAGWVIGAQRFRSWFREEMRKLFNDVDIILAPATPFHALPAGTKTVTLDGVELPARPAIGTFTQPITLVGLPVVAVPVWLPGSRLPIGVQVIAPAWREDLVLRVAAYLEAAGICRAPVAKHTGEAAHA